MSRRTSVVLTVLLAAVAAASLLYAPSLVDAHRHSALRSFDNTQIEPGDVVEVTIEASRYGRFGRVSETLPEGWTYTASSLTDAAVSIEGSTIHFLLLDTTRFTYTVTAPNAEGTFSFEGVIEDDARRAETVGGDTDITVAYIETPTPTPTETPTVTPTPTETPTPTPPETGGTSPTSGNILWTLLMGTAIAATAIFLITRLNRASA